MIREMRTALEYDACVRIIRESFQTVAEEFHLTAENAPSHPSNTTPDIFRQAIAKGLRVFGLYHDGSPVGCIGVEKAADGAVWYIERLAVIPPFRHRGFGAELLDFACRLVRKLGGEKASIGIINEHTVLKNWYLDFGFREISVRRYDHLPFAVCFMEKNIR